MGQNSIPEDLQIFEILSGQQIGQISVIKNKEILLVKSRNPLFTWKTKGFDILLVKSH